MTNAEIVVENENQAVPQEKVEYVQLAKAADKSQAPLNSTQEEEDDVPKAPDGGYGWVVLLASFLISFIIDGVMYSFGLVLTRIREEFGVTEEKTNWLSSLNTGFLFCSGPIVAGLANQFGCRVVVMGGAIITSIMYVITAFAPSVYLQMFTFGVVGGISTGCTYIASLIVIAQYFDKKRGIATGITMAGSGVGAFAFAPLLEYLIGKFDWRYTMVIEASIILQCAILGCLLKPLAPKKSAKNKKQPKKKQLEPTTEQALDTFSGSILSLNTLTKKPFYKRGFFRVALDILREMTNFSLLRENKGFLLVTLSNFFIFLGYFIPFLYIPIRAKDLGLPNHSFLLSIIGIVNIPVRMLFGFIADRKIIAPINLNTFSVAVAIVPLFVYAALTTFTAQAGFSVTFAIGIAGINSLTTMYLVELVGLKKFNNATGIVNLFRGFGCFLGAPIGGLISTQTGSILNSFYYSGVCFSVGFVLTALVSFGKLISQCCCKKKNQGAELDETKNGDDDKSPEAEGLVSNKDSPNIVKV